MRHERWRVKRLLVDATAGALGFPAEQVKFAVWGIWPPQWDIARPPLLYYPMQRQAMSAAAKRADFAVSPDPAQQTQFQIMQDMSDVVERLIDGGW
jgi:hypothetical protein